MKTHPLNPLRRSAFSLVEVVLALGLVSFCLLSVVGLLPVGLKSIKNARTESAAANALNQLADALRNATTNADGSYVAAGVFSNITWIPGSAAPVSTKLNLALNGEPTNSADSRLVAQIEILPPSADLTTPGRARVTIAWPAVAEWSNSAWSKSEGSVNSGMQFLPRL
jgi:type II secretory pathway pseudopilin PulG